MNVENYFEQEKGITVDAARNNGERYTAIDVCRFAKNYHERESKNIEASAFVLSLPSDEEILKEAYKKYPTNKDLTRNSVRNGWIIGMKEMRDLIKKQNGNHFNIKN